MILISKTYSRATPESAIDGEESGSGYLYEDSPHTFRELVAILKDHPEPSCSPLRMAGVGPYVWFSCYPEITDYSDGTEEQTSIHYSRNNPGRNLKYWAWAARAAGLTKG